MFKKILLAAVCGFFISTSLMAQDSTSQAPAVRDHSKCSQMAINAINRDYVLKNEYVKTMNYLKFILNLHKIQGREDTYAESAKYVSVRVTSSVSGYIIAQCGPGASNEKVAAAKIILGNTYNALNAYLKSISVAINTEHSVVQQCLKISTAPYFTFFENNKVLLGEIWARPQNKSLWANKSVEYRRNYGMHYNVYREKYMNLIKVSYVACDQTYHGDNVDATAVSGALTDLVNYAKGFAAFYK
ncbi:MAG: hypothetical protein ACI9TY_000539 [Alphaproteobacteria bacterium]|jgi:hypothetical protein